MSSKRSRNKEGRGQRIKKKIINEDFTSLGDTTVEEEEEVRVRKKPTKPLAKFRIKETNVNREEDSMTNLNREDSMMESNVNTEKEDSSEETNVNREKQSLVKSGNESGNSVNIEKMKKKKKKKKKSGEKEKQNPWVETDEDDPLKAELKDLKMKLDLLVTSINEKDKSSKVQHREIVNRLQEVGQPRGEHEPIPGTLYEFETGLLEGGRRNKHLVSYVRSFGDKNLNQAVRGFLNSLAAPGELKLYNRDGKNKKNTAVKKKGFKIVFPLIYKTMKVEFALKTGRSQTDVDHSISQVLKYATSAPTETIPKDHVVTPPLAHPSESSQSCSGNSKDVSSKDTSSKDISSKDISSKDISSKNISSKDTSSKDTSSKDIRSKDISSNDTSSNDANSKNTSYDNPESSDSNSSESSSSESSSSETDNESSGRESCDELC